jgi:nucleotide-binding universal stress UspA family protein
MSNVLHRILVPTDGSPSAESALMLSIRLAREHEADLLLCNTIDYVTTAAETSAAFAVDLGATFASLDEAASRVLSDAGARIKAAGVRYEAYKLEGRPARAIVAFAIEREVDAIVMGTRGMEGLAHLVFGSTAESVLRAATVPVFVVHARTETSKEGRKPTFGTILVAIDDSDPSDAAAAFASGLAAVTPARLVLTNVIDTEALHEQAARHGDYLSNVHEEWIAESKQLLGAVARQAQDGGVGAAAIEQLVLFGDPVDCILQQAKDRNADLIAIGTHGRRGLRRLAMGSIAEGVVRRSSVPVVVVRATAELRRGRAAGESATTRPQLVGA